ncbi:MULTISPECIES: copper resistance system multicopper oxidase [Oleiagrimonas]|uniref:Copper resistance system multicopper oxidase n=1 Tax=Oleiagrimonas citrea TaxID=1665687 RepID=A0A846ZIG2_9GAMM|nr:MULTISPECIES: copper resistance system multicopper oxidase [Oleiagrimonas]NKZ37350.1 copper resistance system multicopper oxidase [Oleiagrimonas citrea]RAP55691.1 copper resistance protein CopA [Oleiagrimonas sp. MCCC 1A03011]
MSFEHDHPSAALLSRRRFVLGLGGAAAGLALLKPGTGWAADALSASAASRHPAVLRGTHFKLDIAETPVNITGRKVLATAINGQLPAPVLHWREGDLITLDVRNRLPVSSSIHWHGILLPFRMDGVPGLSYPGIAPGGMYRYHFRVKQSGTYWYHSHTRFQEQTGLYGAIVVEPRDGERFPAQRDYVMVLSDWSDSDPETIYANLKKMGDYYSRTEPTIPELMRDARAHGISTALKQRLAWDKMRMSPRDLSDVTGYTYTYLINGVPPAGNWTGLFKHGEKVRLRFINASAMTYFDVRIPGLKMTVVATDGQDIDPVSVEEFRIGVAETLDVIVEPAADRAWTVFAQAIDRSGFALATLAPREGMRAEVPAMDPIPSLTMADMGMNMAGMKGMAGMKDMAMGSGQHMAKGHDMSAMQGMAGMSMSAQTVPIHHHYPTEYGPQNTKCIDVASTALDDPGAGLRNNGRRVLTYADMHTIGGPIDDRAPGREIELHLTGNMGRYMWSFNGVPYDKARPILFHHGERLRIVLINDTMMNHPIHMHGMWSEVETPDGEFRVRKHTVNVRPAQRISYRVTADALGRWAYHCHMLYHMDSGMFRAIVVK